MIFGREPALWLGLVQALLALGIGFGLDWSTEQMALAMTAATAVASLLVRVQVTPLVGGDPGAITPSAKRTRSQ